MTCSDVERLLDAFIDRELPPPMLLEVARHASACPPCDETVRQFAALGEAVGQTVALDVDALDLSGVWPAVATAIDRETWRRRWRQRLRQVPAAAITFAAAASLAIWLTSPGTGPGTMVTQRPLQKPPLKVARLHDQPVIARLAGKDVAVRSEPKAGTTLFWVNYPVGAGGFDQ
jgi:anti-sigma factor RsiW